VGDEKMKTKFIIKTGRMNNHLLDIKVFHYPSETLVRPSSSFTNKQNLTENIYLLEVGERYRIEVIERHSKKYGRGCIAIVQVESEDKFSVVHWKGELQPERFIKISESTLKE
jgi:hypothetical protein